MYLLDKQLTFVDKGCNVYLRIRDIHENQRVADTLQPTQKVRRDVYLKTGDILKNQRAASTF